MSEDEQTTLFRQWVEQCTGLMARVARAYTATKEDCEDLVQEILLQVWRSIPCFERKSSPSTWIYRVALNTALAWQRKNRRQRRFQPLFEVEQIAEDNGEQVQKRERIERLYAGIRQLPKADAALLVLYLDDLSYREMAEILGISETNVGVKLNRARRTLAKIMKGEMYESR
ncbi:MAG: RNA polymerase sigma factor [Verrucomicrobia bacterium]|jgi:RNA polymerase sigma-70 factor (ECF subfamily)|nr:RNA polymerase sigma factor [Verrucomicrobiota bacterium]